jgi:glycosyltransferase involved in cell wall biosynthesis
VDHTAKISGAEIAIINAAAHLDLTQYVPVFLLFEDGPLADRFRQTGETFILTLDKGIVSTRKNSLGLQSLLRIGAIFRLVWFSWQVSRLIRKQNIDLVHTNSLKADLIGGIAGRLAGRPVVWHIRDRISNDYLPPTVVKALRAAVRFLPTHTITASEAVARTLTPEGEFRAGGADQGVAARFTVVHDGTDLRQAVLRPSATISKFGLVGRLSPWKGQHIFIRAAAQVHKEHPSTRFLIIGSALFGESKYEEELRSLVEELSLGDAVEFAGFCSDVPERIASLDVVVHASTLEEPFGQVIIEGMAAAKPVIATRGGGVPEIIEDGVDGLLVPMGDSAAMAHAMMRLIGNADEAIEIGRRGRTRVEKSFRIELTAAKIQAVYDRVLARPAGGAAVLMAAAR